MVEESRWGCDVRWRGDGGGLTTYYRCNMCGGLGLLEGAKCCGKMREEVRVVSVDAVVCEAGSQEAEVVRALRKGTGVSIINLAPPDPPPWKPGVGERVRGWRGKVELIGQYAGTDCGGHLIGDPGCLPFWVERVEPVNEGAWG